MIAYVTGDPHASTPSSPTWPSGDAPHAGAQQKLLDTPLSSLDPNFIYDGISSNDADSDSNLNNDGYHEIHGGVEDTGEHLRGGCRCKSIPDGTSERMAVNADYRIYIDASNTVTIFKGTSTTKMTSGTDYTALMAAITTNTTLKDGRENDNVRVVQSWTSARSRPR